MNANELSGRPSDGAIAYWRRLSKRPLTTRGLRRMSIQEAADRLVGVACLEVLAAVEARRIRVDEKLTE